ncbi:molybdopterin-containing oxidoreductase family protein [Brenneria tiliae]|uniref:molybdopterin-containing oxidoreductase family protein n=1 Tax=Brenneria tiliae TaxID=2914984 RepID=UPI002014EFD7|nr:molybdopterin-dependent oxidoreductase [Brenneria tiliae]MCL2898002.1 molybdopterin-dependent oxidoreductase [Brenneria tiliae]MCL2902083.1 molybdopterin-dependent oxidoreductase [Brenneria tiliae]
MEQSVLSRRDFFKATAITGVAGVLGGSLCDGLIPRVTAATQPEAETPVTTKIVKTNCRACIHNCGVLAHVRNGRVIKLEGNPEYPMSKGAICAKGLAGIAALYHPNRNKYPMLRVGARGENKWKRITWPEAIDTIAKKLMETREKYGAETVFGSTGGGGNPEFFSLQRFCNAFNTPNWFEPGCAQCYLPRTLAFGLMYGGPDTSIADSKSLEIYNPDTEMKTLVMWATNASYNSPAGGGRAVNELRAKGVRTLVIDPRFTPDAAKADIWLPIRPGTDVALMLAWIRYILAHQRYDEEFITRWTNLPFLVNTRTRMLLRARDLTPDGEPDVYVVWDGKSNSARPLPYPWDDKLEPVLDGEFTVNGEVCKTGFRLLKERVEPYSLDKAAEICWLDVEKITKAIELYLQGPGGISLGVATDQNENSVQAAMGAVLLNSLMGNVEKPGALMQRFPSSGVAPFDTYIVPTAKKLLSEEQLNKRLGGIEYKGLLQWWAAHPSSVQDAILTGKPYRPRVWLERSGNKLAMQGNASSWLPAIEQMDFIVHMYIYPTSFSAYADILLPAAEWLETDMLVESLNTVFARQAVTHIWETENETLFWAKLAKRCAQLGHENCQKAFDAEFMGEDLPYWETMEELLDARLAPLNISWKEFIGKVPYEFLPYQQWLRYFVYRQIDPHTGQPTGFDTPSRKLELYGEVFITLGRTGEPYTTYKLPPASKDYDPLPYYVEPAESPNQEIAKKYPLVMTNGRLPIFHHGTLRNSPFIREIYPVAEIWINPVTAGERGVAQGDWVWIESLRGKIRAKARVTEGIPPRVVYMERFWNPETLNTPTQGWREMNVNMLTKNDAPFNDVVGTYTLRGFQVNVSKADGPPAGIWQKPEDFTPWLPQPSDPTKSVEF